MLALLAMLATLATIATIAMLAVLATLATLAGLAPLAVSRACIVPGRWRVFVRTSGFLFVFFASKLSSVGSFYPVQL